MLSPTNLLKLGDVFDDFNRKMGRSMAPVTAALPGAMSGEIANLYTTTMTAVSAVRFRVNDFASGVDRRTGLTRKHAAQLLALHKQVLATAQTMAVFRRSCEAMQRRLTQADAAELFEQPHPNRVRAAQANLDRLSRGLADFEAKTNQAASALRTAAARL